MCSQEKEAARAAPADAAAAKGVDGGAFGAQAVTFGEPQPASGKVAVAEENEDEGPLLEVQ